MRKKKSTLANVLGQDIKWSVEKIMLEAHHASMLNFPKHRLLIFHQQQ